MQHLNFVSIESLHDFLSQHSILYPDFYLAVDHHNAPISYFLSPKFQGLLPDLLQKISYKKTSIDIQHYHIRYDCFVLMVAKKPYGTFYKINIEVKTPSLSLTNFNSQSDIMKNMLTIIQKVAQTPFPVLVRGESGSGKELVAQAIHQCSQQKTQPFIAVNCAAFNANLLESELFGHVKGAFTGAIRDHKGMFERAAGGTLFLDEVAEIPLELQAKLLRVLETGEFTPLGGEKVLQSNVRIIAATHRSLREEARLGRFRQDLLYRLRVIPIFIPALRERKDDIPLLVSALLKEHALHQPPHVSTEAMNILVNYDWQGNVRELKNTLLYALTMIQEKSCIEVEDLPRELIIEHTPCNPDITPENFKKLMQQHQNNLNTVASILKVSRSTLWRYRQKWEL